MRRRKRRKRNGSAQRHCFFLLLFFILRPLLSLQLSACPLPGMPSPMTTSLSFSHRKLAPPRHSALDGDLANATRSLRFFSRFSTQSAPLPPAAPSPATHCKRRRVPSILADQLASVSQPAIHPSIRVHQTCGPTTYPHSVAHSISFILLGEKNSSAVNSAREAGFQMNRLFQKRSHSIFLRYMMSYA